MPDDIPADLIQLQRAARAATRALYAYRGADPAEHQRLRETERLAALALAARRAETGVHWRALIDAANAADSDRSD